MKKVSVIIPIYNVERYIKKCLESVVNQTYENLEIILVNDETPDRSVEICRPFLETDKRIRLINKKNGGLSSARNQGLGYVTGDYILFIDSDDYIDPTMVEDMTTKAQQEDADITLCGIKLIDEKGRLIEDYIPTSNPNLKEICSNSFACNKLFSRSFFGLTEFPLGNSYGDFCIVPRLFLEAKKVSVIKKSYYYYLQRSDSLSSQRDNSSVFQLIDGYILLDNYLSKDENYKAEFFKIKKSFKDIFIKASFSDLTYRVKASYLFKVKDMFKTLNVWEFKDNFILLVFFIFPRYFIKRLYFRFILNK